MISRALRQQFPDEPWKWNKKWSDGVIRDGTRGSAIAAWIFALIWNGLTIPVVAMYFRQPPARHHGPPTALLLIFPACGLLLIVAAISQTLIARRFGVSELTITPFPAHPGEPMNATVRVHASLAGAEDVVAKLQCVRREQRGNGRNASTFDNILWDDSQHAPIAEDLSDALVRATFNPAVNGLETSSEDLRNVIVWRLVVRAARKGLDYNATFELPMFNRRPGDASPRSRPFPRSAIVQPATGMPTEELARQRIHIRLLAGRAFAVDFPAGRHLLASLVIFLFGLVFLGVALGFALPNGFYGAYDFHFAGKSSADIGFEMFHQLFRIPFIFGFGLFGMIFPIVGASMLLTGVTVTADRSGLAVVRNFLGFHSRQSINAADIVSLSAEKTGSTGNTVYYSIRAKTRADKTYTFGSGIEDGHVADRLAAAMLSVIQPNAASKTPATKTTAIGDR